MWFAAWPLLLRYRFLILIIHFTLSLANSAALNNARKAPQRSAMVFQGLAVIIWGTETRGGVAGCINLDSVSGFWTHRDTCLHLLGLNVDSWSGGNYEPLPPHNEVTTEDIPSQNCIRHSDRAVIWWLGPTSDSDVPKVFPPPLPVFSCVPTFCHETSASPAGMLSGLDSVVLPAQHFL